jgi:ribonuclease D
MESPPYRLLDRPEEVEAFLASLSSEPELAVDLEADSLHSYREKVCLVQVTSRTETALVDPLRCRDALAPFGAVLASPRIRKVFHGGDYDLRLLSKDFSFRCRNVFDTMIAAQFTGREQFGLAALLQEHFGVSLDKKFQRADWGARPIPPALLEYAALDTAHLLELRARLADELARLGRLGWAEEEFRLLEEVEPAAPRRAWCLDVKGASRLSPRQLAVLQALLEVRERVAEAKDRPPFKVLPPQLLLDWAETPPQSRRAVISAEGASKGALARMADDILEAVRRAQALPFEECPQPKAAAYVPLTGSQERRLKRLKRARTRAAEALRLSPGLLVNSATLERLCRMEPEEAARRLDAELKKWQREAVGEKLRLAVAGTSEE